MHAETLIEPMQCRAARAALGLSQEGLASAVGMSDRTIHGFEKGAPISRAARMAIRLALEGRGCRFVIDRDQFGVLFPQG